MPVFGISTKKVDERLDEWVNTYYTFAGDISQAKGLADFLAAGEQSVHSGLVTINGAHIWEVGNRGNFANRTYSIAGTLDAQTPLPPWFTVEMNLASAGSYPGWKRYRCRASRTYYEGPDWSAAALLIFTDFADYLAEVPIAITTREGVPFTGATPNPTPQPLQLSKRWYNRSTP